VDILAKIELINVTKRFGKVTALDNVSLHINDKEFFVLFGPAGAGKTTILNNIAGIQIPEEGIVKIGDKVVNQIDPANRNIAMVFENYALYPHLSVYDNMASPLRSPKFKRDEGYIKEKVNEVAKMMSIDHLMDRLPSQLSNGQRQRVALGRALVRTPNVFLMDEPLAHLDAKLRNQMRTELKAMQAEFETTSIYVTHDFMEAMSLGDRIAIIDNGEIIQVGTGDEIYYMPFNEFVAQLMGEPEINIIDGELHRDEEIFSVTLTQCNKTYELPKEDNVYEKLAAVSGDKIHVAFRPKDITYSFEPVENYVEGTVFSYESIGNKAVLIVKVSDALLRMIAPNGLVVKLDSKVYIDFHISHIMFFKADTTEYICRYDEASILALIEEQAKEA